MDIPKKKSRLAADYLCACLLLVWRSAAGASDPVTVANTGIQPSVLIGTVESISGVRHLAFGRSGRVAQVLVNVGDKIRKGQLLAVLDCADARAELVMAEAELELEQKTFAKRSRMPNPLEWQIARDRLTLAEADVALAEADRQRHEALFQRNALISRQELEGAARRAMVARMEVATARFAIERLEKPILPEDENEQAAREKIRAANVARMKHQITLCSISSPVDGTVMNVESGPAEMAVALRSIIDVVDDADRLVRACIPRLSNGRAQVGLKVRLAIPASGQQMIDGVVRRVSAPRAAGPTMRMGACPSECEIVAWIEPAVPPGAAPLYSVAYVYVQ